MKKYLKTQIIGSTIAVVLVIVISLIVVSCTKNEWFFTNSKNIQSTTSAENTTENTTESNEDVSQETSENSESFSAQDAIKIEDIDWSVDSGFDNGERTVKFTYTNNSKYKIIDLDLKFAQKSTTTKKDMKVFNYLKKNGGIWSQDEINDIYLEAIEHRFTEPGETIDDGLVSINGTYTYAKSMDEYKLMEPDSLEVTFVGDDGKGYEMYYDFKTQTYGDGSDEGFDLYNWAEKSYGKMFPKMTDVVSSVIVDENDNFCVDVYGVSKDDYDDYVSEVKNDGFSNIKYDEDGLFQATDSLNNEAYITYSEYSEKICISFEQKD